MAKYQIAALINQAKSLIERRRRAKRYGILFSRDQNWTAPQTLRVAGSTIELSYPNDLGTSIAAKDIFVSDVYWLEVLKSESIGSIIDVGAHVGFFSLAARNVFPAALIHAYEPNPQLWAFLKTHASAAGFESLSEAVSSHSGRASLVSGVDTVFTQCLPTTQNGNITVTSIGEAIQRISPSAKLDLLKMDCEGAEWEILEVPEALSGIRFITMEYHLSIGRDLAGLHELLTKRGFKIRIEHADGELNGRILAERVV
jgi:FkbM family methyltransferase